MLTQDNQLAEQLGWIHHFEGGSSDWTLLLLHGTGANERQLLPVARQIAPTANLLAVRGRSQEEGINRFFRRFSAVRYDQEHLRSEAAALAQFVNDAAALYGIAAQRVVALGYSNGANIALASLLAEPRSYGGAILARPVMALDDPPEIWLGHMPILLLNGVRDPYGAGAIGIEPLLTANGADVEAASVPAGHELTDADLALIHDWWQRLTK